MICTSLDMQANELVNNDETVRTVRLPTVPARDPCAETAATFSTASLAPEEIFVYPSNSISYSELESFLPDMLVM